MNNNQIILKNLLVEFLENLNDGQTLKSEDIKQIYKEIEPFINRPYFINNLPFENNTYEYNFIKSKRNHLDKYHIKEIIDVIIDNDTNINYNELAPYEIINNFIKNQENNYAKIIEIVYDYTSTQSCEDSKKIKNIITKYYMSSHEINHNEIMRYVTNKKYCKDIAKIIIDLEVSFKCNKEIQDIVKESKLPRRDDEVYQIISSYEPYELTHCISYEMAIRNKDVQSILEKIKTLTLLSRDLFKANILYKNDIEISNMIGLKLAKELETLQVSCDINFDNFDLTQAFNTIMLSITEYTILLEENYYMIYDRKEIVPEGMEDIFKEPNHYESDRELNHYMDKAIEESIRNAYDLSPRYKDNFTFKDGYAVYQASYDDSKEYDINKIFPNFKRPMREFNQTQVAFNMSLPKEEIVKYIEKIKDDYDHKNSSYKTLNELLYGDDTDSRVDERLEHKQKERYADDFFIYDYYTQSPEKHERKLEIIQHKLSQYHGMKIENGRNDYKYISYDEGQMKDIPKQNYSTSDFASLLEKAKNSRTILHHLSIDVIQDRYKKMKDIIDKQTYKALINQFI